VSLHGAWSNHRLNLRRVFGMGNKPAESDAEATRYFPPLRDVDYIVASPYSRGTMGYQTVAEKDVYDVIADVRKRFPIDDDRVYLTGLSMGGGGTLWLGLTRPDVWAAIAPVCPAVPPGLDELAPNALNVPVRLFHGDQDPAVPVDVSRKWSKLLLGLDTKAEYVEYPGVKHNSWDNAYENGAIFDWFGRFRRDRFPDRVRFVTKAYRYASAYWVTLDALTPGDLASIDARFTDRNTLEIATSKLDGFTVRLAGHPKFDPQRALKVKIDGAPLSASTQDVASLSKSDSGWGTGRFVLPAGAKRPGLEGPPRDALSARHVYVYGTLDKPDAEEIQRRRQTAERAADWSAPGLKLLLNLRVIPDNDATDEALYGANVVAFGTKETNSLIARYASLLPMEMNAGAADYGLLFVAPVGDRYMVVNSGLPWWTGAEKASRAGHRFLRSPYQVLLSFPDFLLFKGSLDQVLVEGNFDRNWRLPVELSAKLAASGVVNAR
jgi:hypothetical protein